MNTFRPYDILLPKKNIDLTKWSVVACDQYTSEPEYWERVKKFVGDEKSTLNIIFPEVYLSEGDGRIEKINKTMDKYLDEKIFDTYENALIYLERQVGNNKIRCGIVGAIDLEDYDFKKNSSSLVRATEGTVLERIPPRVKIRENAPLELPHVMILIDDAKKRIIEEIGKKKKTLKKVYDFDLMENSGHITGYLLGKEEIQFVLAGLDTLKDEFYEKYGINNVSELIFAVGDGNHSLATAKTCWENIKNTLTDDEKNNHPARFALCELVNIHDDALEFEPIHRVVFDVDVDNFVNELEKYYDVSYSDNGGQYFEMITKSYRKKVFIGNPSSSLAVGTVQNFIDDYLKNAKGRVDYIHGADVTEKLAKEGNNIGIILPGMKKNELFSSVISDGVLMRKTFSMGEAYEKRFYLECKKIK